MPKFSIIIPVYNVEKYLSRCLESIQKQSFSDFEVILVDDGSPDKSGKICDEFAIKDSRFKAIHKENGGVSSARNAGLDSATGEFISFIDSDDEIAPNYLECMLEYDSDLVIGGMQKIVDGRIVPDLNYPKLEYHNLDSERVRKLLDIRALNSACVKKFSSKIISENDLRFRIGINSWEDCLFVCEYLCCINSVDCISESPYFYHKYSDSTLSGFKPESLQNTLNTHKMISDAFEKRFKGVGESVEWKKRIWNFFYYYIVYVLRSNNMKNSEKRKILKSYFSIPDYSEYIKNLDFFMANDSKIFRIIFKLKSPVIACFVWNLIHRKG